MMSKEEFFNSVKEQIKDYLPQGYQDMTVELHPHVKNNDICLTGLLIKGNDNLTPNIYLDSFYEQYVSGQMAMEDILENVAMMRTELSTQTPELNMDGLEDYGKAKDHLQIHLCDGKRNETRLQEMVSTQQGDFTATYYVCLFEGTEGIGGVAVTPEMLQRWGVSLEQLHADALAADAARTPMLSSIEDLLREVLLGDEAVNLLEQRDENGNRRVVELPENDRIPLYCLSNESKNQGASLILNGEVLKAVGEVMGEDFYVLPSSVHEMMILPSTAPIQPWEMQKLVQEINESQVADVEVLSDQVQYYDRELGVLENAQARQMRKELEKSEKRPESVLKRLSEKKEQGKAEAGRTAAMGKKIPQLEM